MGPRSCRRRRHASSRVPRTTQADASQELSLPTPHIDYSHSDITYCDSLDCDMFYCGMRSVSIEMLLGALLERERDYTREITPSSDDCGYLLECNSNLQPSHRPATHVCLALTLHASAATTAPLSSSCASLRGKYEGNAAT